MANRNLGYDVGVDYTGEQAAQRALTDLEKFYTNLDKVEQAAEEVGKQTGSMFDKATSSWTEFKSALDVVEKGFNKAKAAAAQAWETINRGADLDRLSGQAEALAGSIGTSWESLLADMTEATGGMISQADLTASAVEIIGLGMAKTGPEVARLSRLVGELGWDMQTLTLTLANQSKARLDSLGLSVGDVTKRVEAFKDAGLEAEEAFQLAVIEAGEEKLKLLGSAAETAAGDLKVLEATWSDLTDEFAKQSAKAAAPLATILVAELKINEAIEAGVITQKQLSQAQAEAIFTSKTMAEAMAELAGEVDEYDQAQRNTEEYNRIITEQRQELTQVAKDQAQAERELAHAINDQQDAGKDPGRSLYTQGVIDARIETYAFKDALYEQADAMTAAANAADAAEAAQVDFATNAAAAWGEYVAAIQSASGDAFTAAAFDPDQTYSQATATYELADSMGYGAAALAELAIQYGLVTEEQAAYAVSVAQQDSINQSIAGSFDASSESILQMRLAIEEANRILAQGPPVAIDKWDASAFFDSGGDNVGGRQSSIVTGIQQAVDAAQGIVDGFVSPEDAYEIALEANIDDVETKAGEAKTLIESIEGKTVYIDVEVRGIDDAEEAIAEID